MAAMRRTIPANSRGASYVKKQLQMLSYQFVPKRAAYVAALFQIHFASEHLGPCSRQENGLSFAGPADL